MLLQASQLISVSERLFEPDQLSGLLYWFRADRSLSTDGDGLVTNWGDLSGNALDVSQGTANKRPSVVSNAVNGIPALRFDGSNDELFRASVVHTQPIHLFVVAKARSVGSGAGRVWSTSPTSASGTVQPNLVLRNGPTMRLQASDLDGASVATDLTSFHAYSCKFSGTASAIAKDSGADQTAAQNLAGSGASIIIGGGHANWAACDVAEVFAYGALKTGADYTKLLGYFQRIYGLW